MKKIVLIGLPLLTYFYFSSAMALEVMEKTQVLPAIHKLYIFGDSLSDVGKLQSATLSFLPNTKNYFMGRFSDGYLWVDDLTENYHTTVQDSQFIEDYAVGGATAFPYVNLVSIFHWGYHLVGSFSDQFYDFRKTHDHFKPDDLIIIWIGANDLLWAGDMYFCGKLTKACINDQVVERSEQMTIIKKAMSAVKRQIQKMEKYGAQHIILLNLPDFSSVPRYIFQQPYQARVKKKDVMLFNAKLKAFVKKNQTAGHNIFVFDLNKLLQDLIHNKAEQAQDKLTDVIHSCLYPNQASLQWDSIALDRYNPLSMYAVIPVFRDALSAPNYYGSYGLQEFVDKKCGNNYLFWDTVHPTKKGHFVIFQHFLAFINHHFNLSRPHTDPPVCYNLPVINNGWYLLKVSQKYLFTEKA